MALAYNLNKMGYLKVSGRRMTSSDFKKDPSDGVDVHL